MADRQALDVVPLTRGEFPAAGQVLGRAFDDDPLWTEVISDAAARPRTLTAMFSALVKAVAASNGIVEKTPGLEGVALWQPPGCEIGLRATVRSGFALPRVVMRMPAQDRRRMIAVLRQFDERRKQLMPEPHWYVPAIGVDPDHQHRGVGSSLMGAGIERADRGGTPIYLETEEAANVGFYEHLGFELVDEIAAVGMGLPLWLMVRRPAGSPSA